MARALCSAMRKENFPLSGAEEALLERLQGALGLADHELLDLLALLSRLAAARFPTLDDLRKTFERP
jgi:hypothetical protein